MKKRKCTWDTKNDSEINHRFEKLLHEARIAIEILENNISNLYTPEGLFEVFKEGFLPVPYMFDAQKKYPEATKWQTAVINGGVEVVDDNGKPIDTETRYKRIVAKYGR